VLFFIGVVDGLDVFHGVWSGSLFGKMNENIRLKLLENLKKLLFLLSDIDVCKFYIVSGYCLPCLDSLLYGLDGSDT
jgi:hypothetical protein